MSLVAVEVVFAGPLCAVENAISINMFILLSLWFSSDFALCFYISQGLCRIRCVQAQGYILQTG